MEYEVEFLVVEREMTLVFLSLTPWQDLLFCFISIFVISHEKTEIIFNQMEKLFLVCQLSAASLILLMHGVRCGVSEDPGSVGGASWLLVVGFVFVVSVVFD
jgi:hypothetical protein